LILSFPRFDLELLTWFGFVPLFFVLQGKSKWKAFLFSYFTGVIFWSGIIYWLIHVTLPGTIVLILYLSLYIGIFGLVISTIDRRLPTIDQFLLIPSIWVLLEYIRSHLFTGFGWALLGYSQYLNLPIIQIADITGAWGVSFLIIMVNVTISSGIEYGVSRTARLRKVTITILCLILALTYGYYRLKTCVLRTSYSVLKVSVVQGNIPQELKWVPEQSANILHKYARLSEEASISNPDLIVWPEASNPGLLGGNDDAFKDILNLSKKIKIPLLVGTVSTSDEKYFNSVVLINDYGEIASKYDKLHLVPFGEYIPLKKFLPFLETVVPIGDITAGKAYTVFTQYARRNTHDAIHFSVLICFEDLFPELSREFVRRGADFLVNITNDAWYKQTSAASEHFQASVFRAVENRVFLVRAANTGISGFIGPDGKVISKVSDKVGRNIFVDGIDTQELRVSKRALSFYTRYGDILPVACFLFVLYGIMQNLKIRAQSSKRKAQN